MKSDKVNEGIYFFGGKDIKGNLLNKLKFLKPVVLEQKVVHAEFQNIK